MKIVLDIRADNHRYYMKYLEKRYGCGLPETLYRIAVAEIVNQEVRVEKRLAAMVTKQLKGEQPKDKPKKEEED